MATTQIIGGHRVSEQVLGAVREASRRTGADFDYMLAKAAQESGFRPDAEAPTSSATGLYQFIDSTWLETVRAHGARHGLGAIARQITVESDGRPAVADPATRQRILDLRRDPRLNAVMAGELANDNRAHLDREVGGTIGPTELYLAHFLGAEAATSFIVGLRTTPGRPAAELFPAAARANRAVFFDRDTGAARSLAEVHARFGRSLGNVINPSVRSAVPPPLAGREAAPANQGNLAMAAATSGTGPAPAPRHASLSLFTLLYLNALPVPGDRGVGP